MSKPHSGYVPELATIRNNASAGWPPLLPATVAEPARKRVAGRILATYGIAV
jgi:hypothetical protein